MASHYPLPGCVAQGQENLGIPGPRQQVAYRTLGPWLRPIVNHFWWACGECKGSPERLRRLWLSILSHVCNDHTWPTGKCQHPLPAHLPKGRTWLKRDSPAYKLLRLESSFCLLFLFNYYLNKQNTHGDIVTHGDQTIILYESISCYFFFFLGSLRPVQTGLAVSSTMSMLATRGELKTSSLIPC